MRLSREDIGKYLATTSYKELASYFPQYPEPTAEELGCSITDLEEIKKLGGLAGVPVDIEAMVYARQGVPKTLTRQDLLRIAVEELRKQGITNVAVRVASYQGDPFGEARSNAAIWKHTKRRGFMVHLHPELLWYDEDYVRDVVKHEVEHTRREQDWIGV